MIRIRIESQGVRREQNEKDGSSKRVLAIFVEERRWLFEDFGRLGKKGYCREKVEDG